MCLSVVPLRGATWRRSKPAALNDADRSCALLLLRNPSPTGDPSTAAEVPLRRSKKTWRSTRRRRQRRSVAATVSRAN